MSYSLKAASLRWDFWKHGKRSEKLTWLAPGSMQNNCVALGLPTEIGMPKALRPIELDLSLLLSILGRRELFKTVMNYGMIHQKMEKNHIRWPARIRFGLQDSQDSKLGTFGWRNVLETMHTILGAWNHLVPTFLETSWNREGVPESISLQDFHQLFEKSQQSTQFIRLVQKVFHTSRHNKTVGV